MSTRKSLDMEKFGKILIVGFDGLDYEKIKKYGCENLKQQSFGKLDTEGNPLKTPLLWSSIITGEKPEVHGITQMLMAKGEKPLKYDRKIRKFFEMFGYNALHLRKCLMYYLFDSSIVPPTKENMKTDSVFEKVADSKAFDIPGYSDYPYIAGKMNVGPLHRKYPPASKKRIVRDVKAEHMYRKNQIFDNIGKYTLMMQHLHYPDWMQHLYPKEEVDEELYREMDDLAGEILEKVDDDTLVLFCSDHGLEGGGHRDQAFYSANTDLKGEIKLTNVLWKCLEKVDYKQKEDLNDLEF